MDKNKIIIAVLIIVAGGLGFFGGIKYQQGKTSQTQLFVGNFNRNGSSNGQRLGRNDNGMGATTGEIVSSDNNSITVKMQDGSSKIVLFNDKTHINKAAQGTVADLTTGIQVAVFGSTNSDGSVTAQNIQLNPQFGMRRPAGATPSASTM